MRVLIGEKIGHAVSNCQPYKVACAYIGADWQSFIEKPSALEAIIVSPTIGSNPEAIAELAGEIGWDRIFFLDKLHAKLYIGESSVIIGSANLTQNGLGGNGLIELCVELKFQKSVQRTVKFFDKLKARAEHSYGDTKAKKKALGRLYKKWNAAISNRVFLGPERNEARQFLDFELLDDDHFYVSWYDSHDNYTYSEELEKLAGSINEEMHFRKKDHVEADKWVLYWYKTARGEPSRRERPSWMYIHQIFQNGVTDEGYEYPVCAVQWKNKPVPPVPFALEPKVVEAFKWALQQDGVSEYLIQNGTYDLKDSKKGIGPLIGKMKKYLQDRAVPRAQMNPRR